MATGMRADLRVHRRMLLGRGRCSECAESVPPRSLMTGAECPHCGQSPRWPVEQGAGGRVELVTGRWRRTRWWVYGGAGAGSLILGPFPLAASLLVLIALLVARYVLFREALEWLSPRRRVLARFSLRMWMAGVAVATLIAQELLTLIPLVNLVAKPLVSLLMIAIFVEGGLRFIRGRLERDQETTDLDTWEWAVPCGLLVGLLLLCVAAVAAIMWLLSLIDSTWTAIGGLL